MNNRTVMHNLTIPVYTNYSIHKLHRKRNSSDSMNGNEKRNIVITIYRSENHEIYKAYKTRHTGPQAGSGTSGRA